MPASPALRGALLQETARVAVATRQVAELRFPECSRECNRHCMMRKPSNEVATVLCPRLRRG